MPLWWGEHVAVKHLVDDFVHYLYLPRLASPEVLVQAICDGVKLLTWQSDSFAYAVATMRGIALPGTLRRAGYLDFGRQQGPCWSSRTWRASK